MIQSDQQLSLMHIGRNNSTYSMKKANDCNQKGSYSLVIETFSFICLTLLTFLVKKKLYRAIDALDLSQITRILADGNQSGFALYGFNAIVRPKL